MTAASGRMLPGAGSSGRRQVTALFCDIVGSVSSFAGLDPEDVMALLGAYYVACDTTVARFGGHITEYLGDGVLAYFGYPQADEDDAVHAVRAALSLRDAVGGLRLPGGAGLQTRIGVATGLVAIDGLRKGADTSKETLVGETPNLAARLMAIAPPNGIVVEAVTQRIGRSLFTFRDLGGVQLKGFSGTVAASEVLDALPVVGRFSASRQGALSPLLGRAAEVSRLAECWSRACGGDGLAVLIHGEAGIGKSRLIEAMREHVAATAHASVTWHCAPHRGDSELYPITEQIARGAGFAPQDDGTLRSAKLEAFMSDYGATEPSSRAVLADLMGIAPRDGAAPGIVSPERRRELTLDTLLTMMDRTGGGGPALFIVEDLHWADSTTIDLLNRAVALASTRPWLLLLTARPDPGAAWSRPDEVVRIVLDRLNDRDAGQICAQLDVAGQLPPNAVRQLLARCDGIPLFVEEMTKSVLEAIGSSREPGPGVTIPETLHASLIARLDRLGPERRIVSIAAVIGQRFDIDMLAAVAAQPEAEIRQTLHELLHAGLVGGVGAAPERAFTFKHALIRDAAYEALLKRERERLHGQIVAVLQERLADRAAEPELLAFHLTESGAPAEAVPLWAEAGRRAGSRAAHNEAVGHYKSALRLLAALPADPDRLQTRRRLLLGLATSLVALRGYSAPELESVLAEARTLSDTLGDSVEHFAVLSVCCGFAIVAGDMAAADVLATRCHEMAEQTQKPRHLTASGSVLGFVLFAKGEFSAARGHMERAIAAYRQAAPFHLPPTAIQDPLVLCLSILPIIFHATGDDEKAGVVADEALVHARALGRDYDLAYTLCWRALFEITRGKPARAQPFVEEALAVSDANEFRLWRAVAGIQRVFATAASQAPEQAVANALSALAELDRIGLNLMRSYYLMQVARLHQASGDLTAALGTIEAAIAYAERSGERVLLSPLQLHRSALLALRGVPELETQVVRLSAIETAHSQGATGFAIQAETSP